MPKVYMYVNEGGAVDVEKDFPMQQIVQNANPDYCGPPPTKREPGFPKYVAKTIEICFVPNILCGFN